MVVAREARARTTKFYSIKEQESASREEKKLDVHLIELHCLDLNDENSIMVQTVLSVRIFVPVFNCRHVKIERIIMEL